jgi:hypothetical protein
LSPSRGKAPFAADGPGAYDGRMDPKDLTPYIVPLLIAALFARRILSQPKERRIRPGYLWIAPAYVAAMMALLLSQTPMPGAFAMLLFAVAAAIGIVVGYLRALHQEFSIDPATGNLMSKASPLGAIIFLGVFVVRYALNLWMHGGKMPSGAEKMTPELLTYTDAMLFFAFAMVAASAFETWRRTRPLVAGHKASGEAS